MAKYPHGFPEALVTPCALPWIAVVHACAVGTSLLLRQLQKRGLALFD